MWIFVCELDLNVLDREVMRDENEENSLRSLNQTELECKVYYIHIVSALQGTNTFTFVFLQ
jgi:hypothetical protein